MLLVVRTVLIVLFTVNIAGSIEFDLLVILVVSSVLAWAHSNAICKKWPYNYLESFFHLQLVIFAASMLYTSYNHCNIMAVAYTSIGMSLVVFIFSIATLLASSDSAIIFILSIIDSSISIEQLPGEPR